ncbi:hypothetical protein N7507_006059 [Penicillium longicatenatum]|nr:hypothetical protein N7507_006059 [Penicillium longicatenatum]
MLARRENIEPCHTNTCQWILDSEKYQSWKRESRGLLWIKGKPGAGKSTLMAFLHGKLESLQNGSQGIQLDFFFTARGTEMQRTPLGMIRSLLNQVFDRDATVRPQIREAYEQRCRQFGYHESQWEWPRLVLEELLASVILASASRQHVTVFVDALDEAGAESAQQVAAYFHRLIDRAETKNAAIRICISCRHYPIVGGAQAVEIHIEQYNQEDIATYINDTLIETEVKDDTSEDIRQTLVKQLIQQANGVFQWARLIIPLTRQRILEGESVDDIYCWLRKVPAGLEDIYQYILNEVIEVRNLEQSFLLFQWVSLAERPLTVREMRYALAGNNAQITRAPKTWEKINGFVESDERMKRKIKALSGGLAEIVSSGASNEIVQVVHQSVNDFLRAKGLAALSDNIGASSPVPERKTIILQCQANLYRSCLVYLALLSIRGNISRDSQGKKGDLIQNNPLLAYATVNLFIHAEKAAYCRVLTLLNEQDILQQVLDRWVQIYQILDRYDPACPPKGTTIIHMAAAANLVDIIERMSLESENSEDLATKDANGNTAFHLAARYGHVIVGRILREKAVDCDLTNGQGKTPLTEAASYGRTDFVEWLLLEGVKLEARVGKGESALQAASLEGHRNVVEILLRAGANVNTPGGEYGNALQAAAYGGNSEIVQILLDAGANINAQGGEFGNALQAAAYGKNSEIVQILLDAGANVNAQGGRYGNALQAAAYRGNSEIVQILLDAGANVNAQGGRYGNALQAAAYRGNSEIVQILLDAGANVNARGGEFGNALQAAAYVENNEIMQILLDAGANINARGGEFGNALQAAAYGKNSEIVQILLDAGANINAQGGEYGNALQAAAYGKNSEIVQILLDAGANVNAQGGEFGNALQAAAYVENNEIVQILLDAGANVNARGGEFGNALQAAAYVENNEIMQILLDAGANINAQGGGFGNVLQAAAYRGNSEIVQILLDAGANANAQGGKYGNALQAAVYMENSEIVQILLDAGANINAQGGEFGNALQAAAYGKNSEIVQILLDAGANVNAQGGEFGNAL